MLKEKNSSTLQKQQKKIGTAPNQLYSVQSCNKATLEQMESMLWRRSKFPGKTFVLLYTDAHNFNKLVEKS